MWHRSVINIASPMFERIRVDITPEMLARYPRCLGSK
jgi:hypothetical protein